MAPSKEDVQRFSTAVETVAKTRDCNYIEAIVLYCAQTGIEVETAAALLSPTLKAKLADTAMTLNLIEKTRKLPIDDED
jgi:hypothetical protein